MKGKVVIPLIGSNTTSRKAEYGILDPNSKYKINILKYVSLFTLVIQTTTLVMVMRMSRSGGGEKYLSSTAVTIMEACKISACLVAVFIRCRYSFSQTKITLKSEIGNFSELLKLAVPSFLYTVQNNIVFFALSNLDGVVFQVLYQIKILTTALFSVFLLKKQLGVTQWTSLVLLTIGVAMVEISKLKTKETVESQLEEEKSNENPFLGFLAVLCASLSSGYAGVYFEKVLKSGQSDLWIRNIQMGISSLLFSCLNVYFVDGNKVKQNGFFFGYNWMVWSVILLQAFGGLVVAVVVRYADNILKGFATSYSIVVCLIIELVFFHFQLTILFVFGAVFVIIATYLYSLPNTSKETQQQQQQQQQQVISQNDSDDGDDTDDNDESLIKKLPA